jgi:hypothetical protein
MEEIGGGRFVCLEGLRKTKCKRNEHNRYSGGIRTQYHMNKSQEYYCLSLLSGTSIYYQGQEYMENNRTALQTVVLRHGGTLFCLWFLYTCSISTKF